MCPTGTHRFLGSKCYWHPPEPYSIKQTRSFKFLNNTCPESTPMMCKSSSMLFILMLMIFVCNTVLCYCSFICYHYCLFWMLAGKSTCLLMVSRYICKYMILERKFSITVLRSTELVVTNFLQLRIYDFFAKESLLIYSYLTLGLSYHPLITYPYQARCCDQGGIIKGKPSSEVAQSDFLV